MAHGTIKRGKRKLAQLASRRSSDEADQQQPENSTSLWELPQEICDHIYGHVLSTPSTSTANQPLRLLPKDEVDSIRKVMRKIEFCEVRIAGLALQPATRANKGKQQQIEVEIKNYEGELKYRPVPLDNAILATNKQLSDEVKKYLCEKVPILIKLRRGMMWDRISLHLLSEAQRIRIEYHLVHQHSEAPALPFPEAARAILRKRHNIKSFHFHGMGHRLLNDSTFERKDGKWTRIDHWPWGYSCDMQLYGQILDVIENIPKVETVQKDGFKVSWDGDERIPEDIDDGPVNQYRFYIKKVLKGEPIPKEDRVVDDKGDW